MMDLNLLLSISFVLRKGYFLHYVDENSTKFNKACFGLWFKHERNTITHANLALLSVQLDHPLHNFRILHVFQYFIAFLIFAKLFPKFINIVYLKSNLEITQNRCPSFLHVAFYALWALKSYINFAIKFLVVSIVFALPFEIPANKSEIISVVIHFRECVLHFPL